MASLYIKDQEANVMAERLANARGLTKTAAVKLALRRELERDAPITDGQRSTIEILEHFWRKHGIDGPSGPPADKAFYDSLNDEDEG